MTTNSDIFELPLFFGSFLSTSLTTPYSIICTFQVAYHRVVTCEITCIYIYTHIIHAEVDRIQNCQYRFPCYALGLQILIFHLINICICIYIYIYIMCIYIIVCIYNII